VAEGNIVRTLHTAAKKQQLITYLINLKVYFYILVGQSSRQKQTLKSHVKKAYSLSVMFTSIIKLIRN